MNVGKRRFVALTTVAMLASVGGSFATTAAADNDVRITEIPVQIPFPGPLMVAPGPDGNVWYTGGINREIGRVTPTGSFTNFPAPASKFIFDITPGTDGNMWFTDQQANAIGRITLSGQSTLFPV